MKAALVTPPIKGHNLRGSGIYFSHLSRLLVSVRDPVVEIVSWGANLEGYDLVHFPYFDPFFLTMPLVSGEKKIVTVHDLIPLKYPRENPTGFRGSIKWLWQKRQLKKSEKIITDSESSAADISAITGIRTEKIKVIPLAPDSIFGSLKAKETLEIKEKLRLPDDYLLYVGDVNFNKNIPVLLRSFDVLSREFPKLRLVLAGKGFKDPSEPLEQISALVNELNIRDKLFFPGSLSELDLAGLYSQAGVYIQPSIDEGFGLPVLEAMASGCPAVVTARGSLEEVAGQAALYADYRDPQDLAGKIKQFLTDAKLREKFIKKGKMQSKKFSWPETARQTLEVYRGVLAI